MNKKKEKIGKNFFELPLKEKKRIVKRAVRGSNELQGELAKKPIVFWYIDEKGEMIFKTI